MTDSNDYVPPTYPALDFIVKYGHVVAIVSALCLPLGGLLLWATGGSAAFPLGGVAAGAFLYLIMRSYTELVRVIVDMLLPK